jgi:hypothetical protein
MPAGRRKEENEVAVGAACVDPSLPALMRSEERPAGRGGKGF